MANLQIQAGGKQFVVGLNADVVTLGRGLENTIRLQDLKASRKHCQIVKTGQGYVLQDLSSGNGTVVNDQAVREHPLRDGDRISIGGTTVTFREQGTGPAPAPTPDAAAMSPQERAFAQTERTQVITKKPTTAPGALPPPGPTARPTARMAPAGSPPSSAPPPPRPSTSVTRPTETARPASASGGNAPARPSTRPTQAAPAAPASGKISQRSAPAGPASGSPSQRMADSRGGPASSRASRRTTQKGASRVSGRAAGYASQMQRSRKMGKFVLYLFLLFGVLGGLGYGAYKFIGESDDAHDREIEAKIIVVNEHRAEFTKLWNRSNQGKDRKIALKALDERFHAYEICRDIDRTWPNSPHWRKARGELYVAELKPWGEVEEEARAEAPKWQEKVKAAEVDDSQAAGFLNDIGMLVKKFSVTSQADAFLAAEVKLKALRERDQGVGEFKTKFFKTKDEAQREVAAFNYGAGIKKWQEFLAATDLPDLIRKDAESESESIQTQAETRWTSSDLPKIESQVKGDQTAKAVAFLERAVSLYEGTRVHEAVKAKYEELKKKK